ncbi:MAG: alpha/beta hydrolase [Nitrospiraceae bacterium]
MKALINGINCAYTDEGKGMPVVFLHAFPLNRAMWAPQISAFTNHFRVITVDFRGHGESLPAPGPSSVDELALDLKGLLDHLAIPQAVFVGLSMGGYVLFALHRRHAERIKGLVLADTRAQADTDEGRAGRFAMIQTAESEGAGAIAEIMMPRLLSPASIQSRPDLVEALRNIIMKTPVSTITADLRAMADRPDSIPLLSKIDCPTLVLVGSLDQGTPPSDAQLMANAISGARLHVIPGAAHLSNLEQPKTFNSALFSFLKSIQ